MAQLLPALVAACVGIPAGLLLYQLAGGHLSEAHATALVAARRDPRGR